ncbi:MAG: hypothetical protein JEZ12_28440 [Desulfobacterium sp.]|nr:hypothetical protein [Desulfobacterium sp.]
MKTESTTHLVRQYAAAHSLIRKKQVQNDLNLTNGAVRAAVETLVNQGFLNRVSRGVYEFIDKRENPKESPIEDRIWRAMRINTTFSASDVSQQAGSTISYVYKRFRTYREDKIIQPSGTRKGLNGDWEKVWRLTQKGRERSRAPKIEIFRPDPLIEEAVSLNRIICSGRAQRNEGDRLTALTLCKSILKRLKEDTEG